MVCDNKAKDTTMAMMAERRRMRRRKMTRPPGSNQMHNQIEDNIEDVERYCRNCDVQGTSGLSKARNSCLQAHGRMGLWCPASSPPQILS